MRYCLIEKGNQYEIRNRKALYSACTEERIQIANEQGYNSGPHIVGHVKNVKQDAAILPWGAWYVLRKEDDSF